jgi:glutamate 5-kinase
MKTFLRPNLSNSKRIIVKIGTSSLTTADGSRDLKAIRSIVKAVSQLQKEGNKQVILVSSGAIGAGLAALGLKKRPKSLSQLQMAAAVGQSKLMAAYDRLFAAKKMHSAQVLLTHADLSSRSRHINIINTFEALLSNQIVPIVNENDVVSVDEIRVGDNDFLAVMVAIILKADLITFVTSADGVRTDIKDASTKLSFLPKISKDIFKSTQGRTNQFSTGGMSSKLLAAQKALTVGIPSLIIHNKDLARLNQAIAGSDIGTLIGRNKSELKTTSSKKRYLEFFKATEGELIVDAGAAKKILQGSASLLLVGITQVLGDFKSQSFLSIKNSKGKELARGICKISSQELRKCLETRLGSIQSARGTVVIHRDNLIAV